MFDYFSRVPEAALFDMFDGHRYANIPHRIDIGAVFEYFERPRMMQFNEKSFIKNGEAYIYFGSMGDAIAQTASLPFAVTAIKRGQ